MAQTRKITVKIAGKDYAMTIPQQEEEKYRRAARDINSLISSYRSTFAAEPEDYLAMAAMQMAVIKVGLEMDRTLTNQMNTIEEISGQIDHYLNDLKE